MKFYELTNDINNPIKVFGLPPFYDGEGFSKCHKSVLDKITRIKRYGQRSCGGRVCFRTNAPSFTLKMVLRKVEVDNGISIYGASSADVYIGDRPNAFFIGLLSPKDGYSDDEVVVERTFPKLNGPIMEDVTVILPRNETVKAFYVGIDEEYTIEEPTPYVNEKPVIFYGSSITEGGCASRVGCSYVNMLSMKLNMDYINYGFSGNARGDLDFADYIISMNPSIVVYDYDHNAPDVEFLENTHEAFYKKIRKGLPNVPILMMTRPDFLLIESHEERRRVIKKTYDNAVASGDKNVKILYGNEFFPKDKLFYCSIDRDHPNDLGFSYMADAVLPILDEWLN